ncbi:hypothetical protein M409DRAFT_30608 [Zasmidium cellare ATCC 36951]|uniref:AB hydrolase-1 domain-containing protein n=1 Tax=Zasmidium cellare ATCC 36951 TaxID=1080233 RepID=A0A6A6BZ80_ZASCE|nr:uncharacterized protein M409DRAFT_30608 [Zasmidium cellare ATCC 36951]KAF2158902.1 hypothetical protein M409DRAFT_30608 [Zasmidium cellare ATCC 36951]
MALADYKPSIPIPPPGQTRDYPQPTSHGKIPFSYPGKGPSTALSGSTAFWIWGDLSTSSKPPLIALHGGPGMPHTYMLPFALIYADYGIPVIMYDQIGSGESTRFKNRVLDADFWTPELFVEELENLIKHFKLTSFDLLGHSWGGHLATTFALEKQPKALRKLIICNSPSDLRSLRSATRELRGKMPQAIQDTIDQCEQADSFESEDGMTAMMYMYTLYGCRVQPWPKELMDCMAAVAEDNTCYKTMAGTSAMTMDGTMMHVPGPEDRLDQITEETCPGGLMMVTSTHDMAPPETMTAYFTKPKCRVKWVHLPLSSHFTMLEETDDLMKHVGTFLNLV